MQPLIVKLCCPILFTPKHTHISTLCMNILNLHMAFVISKFKLTDIMSENIVLSSNLSSQVPELSPKLPDELPNELPDELPNELPDELPELPLPVRTDLAYQAWI